MDGPAAEDLMAMHPNADVMMLRAAVHGQFTDEQLEKVFQVKSKFMDAVGPKMAELKSAQRALYDQLTQPEMDKGKVQALQGKINSLHADMANARLDQQIGLLGVLTPEQRKDLRRGFLKMEDFGMGGMKGGMHHGWRGGGCGPHGGGGGHHGEHHGGSHHEGGGSDHKEHASSLPVDKS
jgi:Spy/CpxP family protein refolding chaperone